MNTAAVLFAVIGIITALLTGGADALSQAVASSSEKACMLCITLAGSMALWSGVMKVAEECGIVRALNRAVRPLICKLLPELDRRGAAVSAASMNFAANLLGLGNAATPLGIKAAREIWKELPDSRSERPLAAFTLLNTSSVQLIPASVIALRTKAGSASPADIVLPVVFNSLMALLCGLAVLYILGIGDKKIWATSLLRHRC